MDNKQLTQLAIKGLLWEAAHDNMGIYPQSIVGGENAYEKRTERMEGWNECISAHTDNYYVLDKWYRDIPEGHKDTVSNLLLEGKLDLNVSDKECNLYINCSDMFFWGCSDGEDVSFNDLEDLKACLSLTPESGADLWICRKRSERPQGAYYTYIERGIWPLFDACGPEREVGFGNPYKPGEYQAGVCATK